MTPWWIRIDHFLNDKRLTYAWIAGCVLWVAWVLSSVLGPGNLDLAGQPIGTDYLQFYSAATTLRQGRSADLYNFGYQSQIEQGIIGSGLKSFHAFLTPPFLAWLYVPLSYLPYSLSFIVWCLLGLMSLYSSIRLLSIDQPDKGFLWSLTWFPVFAAISFGQNSLLSLLIFSITYCLWLKGRIFTAGLVSSLLLFKPQLVLGIGLLWLLESRKSWKSLLGLIFGGGILAGLCFWLLPDASRAYIGIVRNFLPGMIYQDQFPLWHLHSLRGFWILLFPHQTGLAEGLSLLLSLAGIAAYIFFWRQKRFSPEILFAGAICLTIWITPHAMIYDWSILVLPAMILWQAYKDLRSNWKVSFSMIWLATFLSGPLTYIQLKVIPYAVQISVPVFLVVIISTYQMLKAYSSNHVDMGLA